MNERTFCAALIAGGRSQRMGQDKAALELDGVPLWRRQLEVLRALKPDELVISGPFDGPWAKSGVPCLADEIPAGPLAGLLRVLETTRCERVLALAVDLPAMTADYLAQLLARRGGAIPQRAEFFEPLAAVYPTACRPIARQLWDAGERRLREVVIACQKRGLLEIVPVNSEEERLFLNLNTSDDVAAWKSSAASLKITLPGLPPFGAG